MQSNLLLIPLHLKWKKIQGLFKDLHRNSRTFQGKMAFKDFSRTHPEIQGLFKTVRTLIHIKLSWKRNNSNFAVLEIREIHACINAKIEIANNFNF